MMEVASELSGSFAETVKLPFLQSRKIGAGLDARSRLAVSVASSRTRLCSSNIFVRHLRVLSMVMTAEVASKLSGSVSEIVRFPFEHFMVSVSSGSTGDAVEVITVVLVTISCCVVSVTITGTTVLCEPSTWLWSPTDGVWTHRNVESIGSLAVEPIEQRSE